MSLINASLKPFLGETPIHGFGFIGNAPSKKFICFWSIIILAAVGCCINDFITLVTFYNSVPTMVSIEVHRKAEFEPPVPVMCIELNHFYMPPPVLLSGNNLTSEFVPTLLQSTKNLTSFTIPLMDDVMPYDLFYYTYVMLGYMASFEIVMSEHNYVTDYWDMFDMVQTLNFYKDQEGILVEQLFQTYKSYNVSFDRLSRLIAASICNNYILRDATLDTTNVKIGPDTFNVNICSPEDFTHLSLALMCFRIGNSSLWSTPNFDLQINQVASGAYPTISEISPDDMYNNFQWHLDFQGRPVYGSSDSVNVHNFRPPKLPINLTQPDEFVYKPDGNWLPDYFNKTYQINYATPIPIQLTLSVLLSNYYKFYNKESKPCSTPKQRFNSELEQRAEYFYRKCGCWPTQLYLSSNSTESCWQRVTSVRPVPNDQYSLLEFNGKFDLEKSPYENLKMLLVERPLSQALQQHYFLFTNANNATQYQNYKLCGGINETFQLVEECEMIQFAITESIVRSTDVSGSFIRIEVRNEVYNAILESPYKNWSTFVSELGGSIGVWLGGSLIAFLHIPLFIGNAIVSTFKQRKEEKNLKIQLYSNNCL